MSNTSRIAVSRSSIAGTVAIFAFTVSFTHAQTNLKYQLPPKAIVDIVDAAKSPLSISATNRKTPASVSGS